MSPYRSILLITLFFLDVHVRAEGHGAHHEAPAKAEAKHEEHHDDQGCWGQVVPCGIKSESQRRELVAPGLKLVMGPKALVEQRNDRSIQLINGKFLVEMKSAAKLGTPYAEFTCEGSCKALFQRSEDEVTLKVLQGQWSLKRLGEKRNYRVDAGLQVSVSEVTDAGVAEMEYPQSLPWLSTVKEWAALYTGESHAFKAEMAEFRESWKEAVESASAVHEEAAGRVIASHESGLAKERARQKREQYEDERLRDLFRKKNDFD